MTAYEYQSLCPDRKEIRLLYFEPDCFPGGLQSERRVYCRMKHVSLLEEPIVKFNAISYCWGQNPRQRSIKVDGLDLSVPESAEEALRRTYLAKADYEVPAWIDGICINQVDMTEKARQVAMMGEVYRKASEVLVWLGEESDSTKRAILSVYTILDYCRELSKCPSRRNCLANPDSQEESSTSDVEELPLPPPAIWDAMYSFFEVPYFTRLWPVQEIVLARDATVIRGSHSIPWADIAQVADMILMSNLYLRTASRQEAAAGHYGFGSAGMISALKRSSSESLSNLLYLSTNFTTSDTRDRVYAILGMLQTSTSVSEVSALLNPDYGKPVRDVYINATLAAMKPPNSLLALRTAQYCAPIDRYEIEIHKDNEEIPSWVARYDLGEKQERGTPSYFDVKAPGATEDVKANFIHSQATPTVLHIQGVVLDVVSVKSRTKPWELGPLHFGQFIRSLITPPTVNHAPTADSTPKSTTHSDRAAIIHSALLKGRETDRDAERYASITKNFIENARPSDAEKRQSTRLLRRGFNRSLFVTSCGLTGMGPWSYEPGDSVVIVFGCVAPLILRQEGVFWRMMGDAYVDGIMEGQYIEHLRYADRLEADTQWFSIH